MTLRSPGPKMERLDHTHTHTHDGHGKQAVDQDSLSVSPHNMSRHNSVA